MLDTPGRPWDSACVLTERGGVVSAIEIPDGSLFGLDNLPYGIFAVGSASPRAGVRVADSVIDLAAALRDEVFTAPALNPFMAEGPARWAAARARIAELITAADVPARAIYPLREVEVRLPFEVADYVDFYASEHHASNVGRLFRPARGNRSAGASSSGSASPPRPGGRSARRCGRGSRRRRSRRSRRPRRAGAW